MPGFDRTGPWGRGYCVHPHWGCGPHYGWGGGFGRGWRHRFWAPGIPGHSWWGPPTWYESSISPEDEIEMLRKEAEYLEKESREIRRTIERLRNEQQGEQESGEAN